MKNIIINEFRKYIRNPFMVTVLIFFPIIMIYILGNLVENVQTADETIGDIHVAYTAENIDFGKLYQNDQIQFESVTAKTGPELLKDDQVDGYFKIDSDGLTLYEGSSVLMNSVVKGIGSGFLLQKSVYESIMKNNAASLAKIAVKDEDYTTKKAMSANMTMFDYYVIAMTIMTGIFASMASSMTFTEERKQKTMNRLITSPMNKGKIFCAKCLGQIPFAVVQVCTLLIFSEVFFDAQYASSFTGKVLLFALLIMTAVVSNIIGVMISLIFRKSMSVAIFLIGWVMLLFSGCFAKAMTLEPICNFLPPYIVCQASIELNVFGKNEAAIRVIIVEILIMIALVILGGWIFSKKQEERV